MRLLAFSDSHGDLDALERICRAQPNADLYVHLGDGCAEAQMLRERLALPIVTLKGNCDYSSKESDTRLLTLDGGERVFCTHGHRFHVKYGLDELIETAEGCGALAVLYGHTHEPQCRRIGSIWYVNPGRALSCDGLNFATLDFVNGVLIPNLAHIAY